MTFGTILKRERVLQGIKQISLAKQISISSAALSMIEHNKSFPSYDTLKNICKVLDINFDDYYNKMVHQKYPKLGVVE